MVKRIFCLLSFLICLEANALTEVIASVDKNPVIMNESFVLTITADDDVDSNALDTSALLNDFVVGRTSVSSQTSMVNFNTSRLTKWTTVLIAKKEGTYTIPAFSIEGQKTKPITLTVVSPSNSTVSGQQDLFITNDISSNEVFVQQQLTLKVKLHFSAELKRGSLSEPSLAGASIAQIGKDIENETIINGRRYRVIERTYAISPQQSGEFTIKSPVFSGEVMQPSTRRSNFLSFAETKPVSVIGEEISISVKPIPIDYQGVWLPSELIALHQEWQPSPEDFKAGEPITRVLTLTAAGLSKDQLPLIDMEMPAGLKVYPDQAELHTGINNNRLVSQKVRNFAIVASKPGTYLLPEISIPWWNTKTNRIEHATIPAERITIAPNAEATSNITPSKPSTDALTPLAQPSPTTIIIEKSPWLQWLFLGLWLLTCVAWWISAKRNRLLKTPKTLPRKSNDIYLALLAAAKKKDTKATIELIIPWYNQLTSKQLSTLSDVSQHVNNIEFEQAISELQQSAYGKTPSEYNSDKLLNLIQTINKNNISSTKPTHTEFTLNP
ncbi:BatD family protein [Thalassotalea piscium]|uniref:BatD family protein n=1 Tax=Thalassotalea piscium TaxID=1230533 RepID=UPI002573704E|nr:BatD family protein [Thalassotalea piscium]